MLRCSRLDLTQAEILCSRLDLAQVEISPNIQVRRGWARKAQSGSLEDWVRRRRHKEVPAASGETGKRDLVAKRRVTRTSVEETGKRSPVVALGRIKLVLPVEAGLKEGANLNPPPPNHLSPPEKKDQWQRPSKRALER